MVDDPAGKPRVTLIETPSLADTIVTNSGTLQPASPLIRGVGPDPIMQFFSYAHLPAHLQPMSKPFGDLATWIITTLPRNPERTVALRRLLESKDAAVRAALYKEE